MIFLNLNNLHENKKTFFVQSDISKKQPTPRVFGEVLSKFRAQSDFLGSIGLLFCDFAVISVAFPKNILPPLDYFVPCDIIMIE